MKKLMTFALALAAAAAFAATPKGWTTDYDAALKTAKKDNKLVFVLFTGSDWCGWCKKLMSEILVQGDFNKIAKKDLVLVYVDFPQKQYLSESQQAANNKLKQSFAIRGYPTIFLVDGDGKQVERMGYAKKDVFIKKLTENINSAKADGKAAKE